MNEFDQRLSHVIDDGGPLIRPWLTKESHGRVPRTVAAAVQPSLVGEMWKQRPDWNTEGPGKGAPACCRSKSPVHGANRSSRAQQAARVELVQAGELFISAALQLQTVPANLRLVEQSTNEVEVERTPRVPVPRAPCDPYSRSAGA